MRATRLPQLMTAALAIIALPAPALAHPDHDGGGGGSRRAKPAAKAPAKPGKPAAKPAPAKPMTSECCMPEAAAPKPQAAATNACCAEGMKAGAAPGAACCEAGAKAMAAKPQAPKGEQCCDQPKADGSCCSPDKPHGMPGKRPNVRVETRIERRWGADGPRWGAGGRGFGHRGMMMRGDRLKGHEVRFMPAVAPGGSQHLIVARNAQLQLKPWLSVGHQMNWALQLGNGPNAGPWFTPYGGFVPRLGDQLGPIRADVGALLGLGGMFRTGQVQGAAGPVNDVLQARLMWVVEPRVELGWRGEKLGVGLVGAYNLNPNMADFGGPSVGLKFTWKQGGWGR